MSGSVLIVMDFWEKLVDGLMEGNGTDCMEEIWRMGRDLTDERVQPVVLPVEGV